MKQISVAGLQQLCRFYTDYLLVILGKSVQLFVFVFVSLAYAINFISISFLHKL